MTIFLNNFFDKILAKYSLKRTKLHHFKKFSRGNMPPNPPNKRNEILDTPLPRILG